MKIAILSSASAGGAGIAAYRIYQAFCDKTDHEVDFFDMNALGQVDLEISPTVSATNGKITNTHFTVDYASDVREWVINLLSEYDVLNVQWASYLISLSEINELAKLGKKIIFTLHDFYYISGGCHYPAGCLGYLKSCIGCPQVDENVCSQQTVIATNKLKREIFSYESVHLSAPSAFIVENAIRSGIVPPERAHVLRNAYEPIFDFKPTIHTKSKSILLIADSFDEQRKGLSLAVDSLKIAAETFKEANTDVTLHLVGGLDIEVIKRLDGSGIKIVTHGHIKEHVKLVEIFKRCEFILTCSYEDNWPNILVESGSYGCIPIVGKWHGCEEFVQKFELGFVADNYSKEAFSQVLSTAVLSKISNERVLSYVKSVRITHAKQNVINNYLGVFKINKETSSLSCRTTSKTDTTLSINHIGAFVDLDNLTKNVVTIEVLLAPFGCQKKLSDRHQFHTKIQLFNYISNLKSNTPNKHDVYGLPQLNLCLTSVKTRENNIK